MFTISYTQKKVQPQNNQTILVHKVEKYKNFLDAVNRAKFIRTSGMSSNTPLIEEK
jgi:hypothetical protein